MAKRAGDDLHDDRTKRTGPESYDDRIKAVVEKLKAAIIAETDLSWALPPADQARYDALVNDDADAYELADFVATRKNELVPRRISNIFTLRNSEHPEFAFKYPPEKKVDQFGMTDLISSLHGGFIEVNGVARVNPWTILIKSENEDWWLARVRALGFVEVNERDADGHYYTMARPEMERVLGPVMVNQMLKVVDQFIPRGIESSVREHDRLMRKLFIGYLTSYHLGASISFLTLFMQYLKITPEYARGDDGVLFQKRRNMLEPVETHLEHLSDDDMAVETATSEQGHRGKTSAQLARSKHYRFITTLQLRLADTTLRYEIYQPADFDCKLEYLCSATSAPPLCIRLYLASSLVPLEAKVDVGDQVLRVFKFYYRADVEYLILYVATARGGLLLRMPCRTLAPVHVTRDNLFTDPAAYDDHFYIDTVDNPYETTFCTWRRSVPRLEEEGGLEIMSTAAVYQRTVENTAVAPDRPDAAASGDTRATRRKLLAQLAGENERVATITREITERQQNIARINVELQTLRQEVDALDKEIEALPRSSSLKINQLKEKRDDQQRMFIDLTKSAIHKVAAIKSGIAELEGEAKRAQELADAVSAQLTELVAGSPGANAGPVKMPLALPIDPSPLRYQPRVGGVVTTTEYPRYVSARPAGDTKTSDVKPVLGTFENPLSAQRTVHGCKVITIPGNGSGVANDEMLRASLVDHRLQPMRDESGRVLQRSNITYATVAVLCTQSRRPKGEARFEIHFHKYTRQGAAYTLVETRMGHEEPTRLPLNGIMLRNPAAPFRVVDFEVLFYADNLGSTYCVQIDIQEEDGTRYTTCSTSRTEYLTFLNVIPVQPLSGVPMPHLLLFDQLSRLNGYRTVRFHNNDAERLRYDYMFFKQRGERSCRFIFMKLASAIPSVAQIDVDDLLLGQIDSFAPDEHRGPHSGFLYLMVDVPVLDRHGEIVGAERQVLHLGVSQPMPTLDETAAPDEQWFLQARMSQLKLDAGTAALARTSVTRCAWCGDETPLRDDVSGRYYCDPLCQSLLCQTKRLL
jgi:archaellum component FlaC